MDVKKVCAFWLPNYTCQACGAEIAQSPNPYLCPTCLQKLPFFTPQPSTHLSPFRYVAPIRQMILHLKHGGNGLVATALAPYLAALYLHRYPTRPATAIIPVPLFRQRLRDRGYNQSDLLAHAVAAELNLPVWTHLLHRTKATRAQKHMDAAARTKNVQNAFQVNDPTGQLVGQTVILIDDVYTTGATTRACAAQLTAHGAQQVIILTSATVVW